MANGRGNRDYRKRGRGAGGVSSAKVRKIVKDMNEKSREKKHHQQTALDQVISTTGVNFNMVPAVAQGTGTGGRIGNEIQWKSYHVRMILKGGYNMYNGQVFRVIWYTPRKNDGTLMPTSTSVTDFLDQEQFIIHSDKIHKIGSNTDRSGGGSEPPTGVGAFKILNFGRKFKKPALMVFDDATSASLLTNHMRCYIVSTSTSTTLSYTTSVDFMSTCYYTDP